MKYRAYQIGLGQQLERPDFVIRHLKQHAQWGYNILCLYMEGAFRFPSHPEFAMANAWTPAQLKEVVQCASAHGIGVIPVVPSLGHMGYCLKHPNYRHLGENRHNADDHDQITGSGQVCPSLKESYSFLEDLYKDILPYCTAGYLHVSLDESFDLGKCPKCRKRARLEGGLGSLFIEHLKKINNIISSMGVRTSVWGDMFYYFSEVIHQVPKNVCVFDWYYYPFKRYPRIEMHNFKEVDSVGKLKRAGLDVWGCSNMGPFFKEFSPRFEMCLSNTRDWWRYGNKHNCEGLLITSWMCPNSGAELNVLGNACAAELWLGSSNVSVATMIKKGLSRFYPSKAVIKYQKIISLLDAVPICGFWNWQILDNPMSKMATLDQLSILALVTKQLNRAMKLVSSRTKVPTEIEGAVRSRDYYQHKELFVRCGSGHLFKARKAYACGKMKAYRANVKAVEVLLTNCERRLPTTLKANLATWKQTRDPHERNPMESKLKNDALTYARIRKHLVHCQKNNRKIMDSCDLLHSCQLLFILRIQKPCWQQIEVHAAMDNKKYQKVHALAGIEFSEAWANPETDFVRRHSVPLPDDYLSSKKIFVRFVAKGAGEFELSEAVWLRQESLLRPSRVIAVKGLVAREANLLSGGWVRLGKQAKTNGFSFLDERAPVNEIIVAYNREQQP